ncbi:MAG: hypothetical protein AMXMBFR82_25310 [Candidatus Hydrogenedentota bacterium]
MLMAAFGGISGNLPALNAVLKEIEDAGIQTIAIAGNLVVGYPWANEVVQRIQSKRVQTVQGELDRLAVRSRRKGESLKSRVDPAVFEATEWTHQATFSRNLEYLGTLPKKKVFTVEGLSVCLCHGTPATQSERLRAEDDEHRFRRQREYANVHIVILGGGRQPFWRLVDDTLFVNPGCAGLWDGEKPTACYATISTEGSPWSVQFNHVPYSMTDLAEKLDEANLEAPWLLSDEYV